MCHECATKILFDFINIEKWYKRKNPANLWICRVYRFFLGFFKNFENLIFPLFWGLRGERGSADFMSIPVSTRGYNILFK
jgi:hypothetical protein